MTHVPGAGGVHTSAMRSSPIAPLPTESPVIIPLRDEAFERNTRESWTSRRGRSSHVC